VTTKTDTDLMNQVRDGRVGVLGTLFERHHTSLYHFCLRMTGNRQVSEDLVQDIFMRMLKHRKSFQRDTAFTPWMYRIARNASIDYLRRASRAPDAIEEMDEPVGSGPSVEEQAAQSESATLLRKALLRLPVERREVLLLSRYQFKTYEEIARSLDCSVSAVKIRAHRAIKQLRKVYQDLAQEAST
jgi:RNA polymerase sigma-70 factor (ECF subfamily)